LSIHEFIARSSAAQLELAREHPLAAFVREWWVQASSLALALLLVERIGFPEGGLGVRLGLTMTLATGALLAGARVIGLYWTERRRVARGDT
jgi:hypothetical protein